MNPFIINLGLDRIKAILHNLGNPHLKLPPVIHIAGTNGKGSTLAFLKSMLNSANYKVHRYTSPHLIRFNERIELADQQISDEHLEQVLQQCRLACLPNIEPTFFELTTAAAFLAFSQVEADILLLETGLGGEFDATNVIDNIFLAIISPISFDHQEFLGNSLQQIASAKAGIIKANRPVLIAKQSEEARKVLITKAQSLNAKLTEITDFILPTELQKISPSLFGKHQLDNLKTAFIAMLIQNTFKVDYSHMLQGAQNTKWQARLQPITTGKIFNMLKPCKLFVDGSHNVAGAKTIVDFLSMQSGKKIAVFSMLANKDVKGFLQTIADSIDLLLILDKDFCDNKMSSNDIAKLAKDIGINFAIIIDFIEINSFIDQDCLIIICGSLYLAGNFLTNNTESHL
jgi:dihydrofolate synthase/folylpolyglutamate synthase